MNTLSLTLKKKDPPRTNIMYVQCITAFFSLGTRIGLQEKRTDCKLHKIIMVTVSQHVFCFFFHILQMLDRRRVNPAMIKVVMPGVGAPFEVEVEADVAPPMIEVTVLVLAGIVVPGITLAALVVPGTSVTPLSTLGLCVSAGTVLGTTVVPRIIVV